MPYKDISDLPKSQVDQYDKHQKKVFLEAYNHAYEEYDHDESAPSLSRMQLRRSRTTRERRGQSFKFERKRRGQVFNFEQPQPWLHHG